MNIKCGVRRVTVIVALALPLCSPPNEVLSAGGMSDKIAVENLQWDGQSVRGNVVNRSGHYAQAVDVRITYNWLWRNEFHPGENNPGWATSIQLAEPLAPDASQAFVYAPPQPSAIRNDGAFRPTAQILGYTAFDRPLQP